MTIQTVLLHQRPQNDLGTVAVLEPIRVFAQSWPSTKH